MLFESESNSLPNQQLRLIRLREVKRRTGMSTSTIYRWMKSGFFPDSIKIGGHIAAWREQDIDQWLAKHIGERASNAPGES